MSQNMPKIKRVVPGAALAGGEVRIECENFVPSSYRDNRVLFGLTPGRIISASTKQIIVNVPEVVSASERTAGIRLEVNQVASEPLPFAVAEKVAGELHPVANPVVDPDNGSVYVTLSGTRGQSLPVSVYQIMPSGEVKPFVSDITNATGMAFDSHGQLFVTSRFDGTVYRITAFGDSEAFAQNLGVATGIAFNRQGMMFVGDREGTIYRINAIGEVIPFASLDPSVAAYHLAFGPDDYLYVSGPTISSHEPVMRISPTGEAEPWLTGFGRPQGLAFDATGNLYVAASWRGQRGIHRITPGLEIETVIAGTGIVGLAIDFHGNALVATQRELHRVPLGVKSLLLQP